MARRKWDAAVRLTCFGILADIAFFQQFVGMLLYQDGQRLAGVAYLIAGTAVFVYLATAGWADVQEALKRERESHG